MCDIASLKDELKVFIDSVSLVENENEELRKKVSLLEQENDQWQDAYDAAKENWRNQGIQHGINVRKQVTLENASSFQAFQAAMTRRSVEVSSQQKPDDLLASLLIRSRLDLAMAEHQQRASRGATMNLPFSVEDFDIEDNHVGIVNRTSTTIKLLGYSLMFRESGAIFKFPDTHVDSHSSLSVWYGAAHNTMRDSSALGSLLWCSRNNNHVTINDIDEMVDLVDPQGTVVASVAANKPRHHVSERLSLFCANTQGGTKRHANIDDDTSEGRNVATSNNQMVLSVRKSKKTRYVDEQCQNASMAITPCTPGTLLARLTAGGRGRNHRHSSHSQICGDDNEKENHENFEEDDNDPPTTGYSSVSTLTTMQQLAPLSCRTPMVGPNQAPNLGAFRPTLFGRRQSGALSFTHAHRSSQDDFVAIRLTCCALNGQGQGLGQSSRGQGLVDMSGWRLIALGNPTMEFVLYDHVVMPVSGRLTLISGTDPRTMATMHSLHAHWRRLDGADDEDHDDEEDDEVDEDEEGTDRSSEFSGGGMLALTPRTTTSSSSNMNHQQRENQHHHQSSNRRHRLRSSEVCEVAGLSALATGDVAAFFLIDLNGHTVCMMQCNDNEDECMDAETASGRTLQVRTVFGDYYPEKKKSQRMVIPKMLTNVSNSMSCVIQ